MILSTVVVEMMGMNLASMVVATVVVVLVTMLVTVLSTALLTVLLANYGQSGWHRQGSPSGGEWAAATPSTARNKSA